uniref:Uncharacterized protein n=1 Tax=Romanomermis culicivorax TaxID=13658 RepID=A0A915L2S7_ROMCU
MCMVKRPPQLAVNPPNNKLHSPSQSWKRQKIMTKPKIPLRLL